MFQFITFLGWCFKSSLILEIAWNFYCLGNSLHACFIFEMLAFWFYDLSEMNTIMLTKLLAVTVPAKISQISSKKWTFDEFVASKQGDIHRLKMAGPNIILANTTALKSTGDRISPKTQAILNIFAKAENTNANTREGTGWTRTVNNHPLPNKKRNVCVLENFIHPSILPQLSPIKSTSM